MTGNINFNTQAQYILRSGKNIDTKGYVSPSKSAKTPPAEVSASTGNQRSFLNHLWQVAQKDPGFSGGSIA